jgi:hypothetical protein
MNPLLTTLRQERGPPETLFPISNFDLTKLLLINFSNTLQQGVSGKRGGEEWIHVKVKIDKVKMD